MNMCPSFSQEETITFKILYLLRLFTHLPSGFPVFFCSCLLTISPLILSTKPKPSTLPISSLYFPHSTLLRFLNSLLLSPHLFLPLPLFLSLSLHPFLNSLYPFPLLHLFLSPFSCLFLLFFYFYNNVCYFEWKYNWIRSWTFLEPFDLWWKKRLSQILIQPDQLSDTLQSIESVRLRFHWLPFQSVRCNTLMSSLPAAFICQLIEVQRHLQYSAS